MKEVELRAFHADSALMKDEKKRRLLKDTGKIETVTRTKLRAGGFGEPLVKMLSDARGYVRFASNEFLILKFDKCLNWLHIAKTCVQELGQAMFKEQRNLNTTKLKDLEGKVIALFPSKVLAENGEYRGMGILGFRNLYDKSGGGDYEHDYKGMQYYGKGGTDVKKPRNKLQQNVEKQGKLMAGMNLHHPDVMGMLYWTTTGLFESIGERNETMWTAPNVAKLKKLWKQGLQEYVWTRNPMDIRGGAAVGPNRKRYMPNIIMIDFADYDKCRVIYDLNTTSPETLALL